MKTTVRQLKDKELKSLATSVSKAAEAVWLLLGPGHTEAIYQKAMEIETRDLGCKALQICPVVYKGQTVGHHVPDLIIGRAVVELKVAQTIGKPHLAQLAAYQRLLGSDLGILINFPNSQDRNVSIQLLKT